MTMEKCERKRMWMVALGIVGSLAVLLAVLPTRWLFDISAVELFIAIVPATLFPILYMSFFTWYRNPLGRALMTKATGLALLIDISCIYALFGDNYPFREHVRFIVFTLVVSGLWYQLVVIIKIKVQQRHEEKAQAAALREVLEEQ